MTALTTSGDESASPMPSKPVSVRTRTRTESWLLAVFAWTFGMRTIWQTISVIFIGALASMRLTDFPADDHDVLSARDRGGPRLRQHHAVHPGGRRPRVRVDVVEVVQQAH